MKASTRRAISAAIRRGLIEAAVSTGVVVAGVVGFPRPFAAASLKRSTRTKNPVFIE